MGLGLGFAEGEGPYFERPLREEAAIRALAAPDLGQLRYVFDAVAQVRRALAGSVPLIGFSGSPFTLACYMVEGRGSRDFPALKALLRERPALLHHILAVNARAVAAYLNAQIEAGAQAVMLFDTWGGTLAKDEYLEYSLAYMRRVTGELKREHGGARVPVILFTKGGGAWLEAIADAGADAVGVDWTVDLGAARARVGSRVALQGNLDPQVLLAGPEAAREGARRVLASFGRGSGHVFNLGHGVTPATPVESVAALVETVHEASRAYH
jgi:uroporphyrinogen decarboxylase